MKSVNVKNGVTLWVYPSSGKVDTTTDLSWTITVLVVSYKVNVASNGDVVILTVSSRIWKLTSHMGKAEPLQLLFVWKAQSNFTDSWNHVRPASVVCVISFVQYDPFLDTTRPSLVTMLFLM